MMTNHSTLLLIFVAATALGVLIQAGVLLGLLVAARMAEKRVMAKVNELHLELRPLIHTSQQIAHTANKLIEDMSPKIVAIGEQAQIISIHVKQATEQIHTQIGETNETLTEVLRLTRAQAQRVDGMVTDTLDSVARNTRIVQESVMVPVRQVGGWISAAKAMVGTFRNPPRRSASSVPERDYPERGVADNSYAEYEERTRAKVYGEPL